MNGGTRAHEGELLPMKGKIVKFWLEPEGGTLGKKTGKHESVKLWP